MDTLTLKLVKTRTYEMKPYGRFTIKWSCSPKIAQRKNVLPFMEVRFNSEQGMPYTPEQEKQFVKFMLKHKTDVLTDGRDFYTRMGDNWVTIGHKKLESYKGFLRSDGLEDNLENWNKFVNSAI